MGKESRPATKEATTSLMVKRGTAVRKHVTGVLILCTVHLVLTISSGMVKPNIQVTDLGTVNEHWDVLFVTVGDMTFFLARVMECKT